MRPSSLGFILLGSALETCADVTFKYWASSHKRSLFALGLFLYLAGVVSWALTLEREDLGKSVALFVVLNVLAVAAIGSVLFGEKPSFLGLVFAVLAILLLAR